MTSLCSSLQLMHCVIASDAVSVSFALRVASLNCRRQQFHMRLTAFNIKRAEFIVPPQLPLISLNSVRPTVCLFVAFEFLQTKRTNIFSWRNSAYGRTLIENVRRGVEKKSYSHTIQVRWKTVMLSQIYSGHRILFLE